MPLVAALQFLTVLRLRRAMPSMDDVARAQMLFPAVGVLIGLAVLVVDRAAMRALPQPSVDVLLVVTLVMLTGALHIDGLADAADGLFGGRDAGHRLAIMRDPHAGTFAIVAVASVLAMKWAGFAALPSDVRVEAIVLAPCLARLAMVVCAAAHPYARDDGLGGGFRAHARVAAVVGGAMAAAGCIALLGVGGLLPLAFCVACGAGVGAFASHLIGGVTGDVYGATAEITEALTLLFIAAMANRGWLDAWLLA
jgi:adenosylcobinamide-GDP ribazoletransferase